MYAGKRIRTHVRIQSHPDSFRDRKQLPGRKWLLPKTQKWINRAEVAKKFILNKSYSQYSKSSLFRILEVSALQKK